MRLFVFLFSFFIFCASVQYLQWKYNTDCTKGITLLQEFKILGNCTPEILNPNPNGHMELPDLRTRIQIERGILAQKKIEYAAQRSKIKGLREQRKLSAAPTPNSSPTKSSITKRQPKKASGGSKGRGKLQG